MKIYRIASQESEIRDVKKDVSDLERDIKDMEKDIKKIQKEIEELNIGKRRFYQNQSTFTSVQRKIERFEAVEQEWKNFKRDMDESVKQQVEKQLKTRVKI